MTTTSYGFRIVGPCSSERRLIDAAAALSAYAACDAKAHCESEGYLSAFTFGEDFRAHLANTSTTKGFTGICGAMWIWFDIDREGNAEAARIDAARLAATISERFAINEDDLLIFFSGSKGFHVGLPTSLWAPSPSFDFNRIARRFCEQIAEAAPGSPGSVVIDTGVYDKVRAFRAPNSRHPKTGLHKRWLTVDALMHMDATRIFDLAKAPAPFEIPTPTASGKCDFNLAADWNAAVEHVRKEAQAIKQRRAAVADGNGTPTLNRLTFDFIREGATSGDRHRLLYSAARNLAEFACPPALAHSLLTESALDSGLSPSDVRRQIECGLKDGVV